MQFHFHANQSHFLENGFTLGLTLKQGHKGTWKWPIPIDVNFCNDDRNKIEVPDPLAVEDLISSKLNNTCTRKLARLITQYRDIFLYCVISLANFHVLFRLTPY